MQRPYIVVVTAASLDGRVALGSNRTQWDELDDPRNQEPFGRGGAWEGAVRRIFNDFFDDVIQVGHDVFRVNVKRGKFGHTI